MFIDDFMISSPCSPEGSSLPSSSMILSSTIGQGLPQLSGFSTRPSSVLPAPPAFVSVIPQPKDQCLSGIRTCRRSTMPPGIGAPPPETAIRLRRSRWFSDGDCSISQVIVGTPLKDVTRSRSISSRPCSGFHLYIITILRPTPKDASRPAWLPLTWNSGRGIRMEGWNSGFSSGSSSRPIAIRWAP